MTCPMDKACGASHTKANAYGVKLIDRYEMSCVPLDQCNTAGIASFSNGNMKRSTTCCNTDNCTPPTPTLPDDNSQANGLICPKCISYDSDSCYTKDTMECTGNENMCLHQIYKIDVPYSHTFAFRGCASKSICSISTHSATYRDMNVNISNLCTSGSFANESITYGKMDVEVLTTDISENFGLLSSQLFPSVVAIAVAKIVYF
ncbi:phospholipase A2 inhibitor and Ly6/PLAUR domain-containing protein-like isoform X2 [Mixophyes fleayi]